jgi:Uma2 family endonuclease
MAVECSAGGRFGKGHIKPIGRTDGEPVTELAQRGAPLRQYRLMPGLRLTTPISPRTLSLAMERCQLDRSGTIPSADVRLPAPQPRTYSVAMPAARSDWTIEMLDALPDDGDRYEVIDGELFVTPAPSDVHQLVVLAVAARLREYLRPSMVGRPFVAPSDVWRGDRLRNRVQPDVFVVRLTDGERPAYPFKLADLLLAVEVVSAGNSAYDYQTKRELYLRSGVPEYWIIDPDARTIARWRSAADPGELLTTQLEWRPAGMSSAIVIDIRAFFEDALG